LKKQPFSGCRQLRVRSFEPALKTNFGDFSEKERDAKIEYDT
jgi:hypothetical protein